MFFFEKKNQKTFATWRTWPDRSVRRVAKVFCFFSSEKKTFLKWVTLAFQKESTMIKHRLSARMSLEFLAYCGLAACWSGLPAAATHAAPKAAVLYDFTASGGGSEPHGGLLADEAGNLYGTTYYGGTQGGGVAYALSPPAKGQTAWTETVLYNFSNPSYPVGSLITDGAGNLYGATYAGGQYGGGTVFELSPPKKGQTAWTQKVLVAFNANGDTIEPLGDLLADSGGNIYGTTYGGGAGNFGMAFEVSPPGKGQSGWTFTDIHDFSATEGNPDVGVILDAEGNLYGVTYDGGGPGFAGTVYTLSPPTGAQGSWTEATLFAFPQANGEQPYGGLVMDGAGKLYGTTLATGAQTIATAFELSPPAQGQSGWSEATIYNFPAMSAPNGDLLLDAAGNLYGTSLTGGAQACGAVFALSPPAQGQTIWTGSVLVSLNDKDGAAPVAGLIADRNGTLYGTASSGGAAGHCRHGLKGVGTVFAVKVK
jgi:uncharacterized repeat protein (TIGR03803 family)